MHVAAETIYSAATSLDIAAKFMQVAASTTVQATNAIYCAAELIHVAALSIVIAAKTLPVAATSMHLAALFVHIAPSTLVLGANFIHCAAEFIFRDEMRCKAATTFILEQVLILASCVFFHIMRKHTADAKAEISFIAGTSPDSCILCLFPHHAKTYCGCKSRNILYCRNKS